MPIDGLFGPGMELLRCDWLRFAVRLRKRRRSCFASHSRQPQITTAVTPATTANAMP